MFEAPKLLPPLPTYPPHVQVCRVTAGTVPGPSGYGSSAAGLNLYVSFTEQFQVSSLQPRDREPCLVVDLNGHGLSPGYYAGRLCGNYNGLPVYEVGGASLGGTTSNIVITQTTAIFIVPAPPSASTGSSSASPGGTVLIQVLTTAQLSVGDQVEINDGVSIVIGYVASIINNTSFLFQTVQGPTGATIAAGAFVLLCCPIGFSSLTKSNFTIPALNVPVTVQVTKTNWMVPNMEVLITDSINALFAFVDAIGPTSNPPTVTLTPTRLDSGIVGGTMNGLATVLPVPAPLKTPTTASFVIPSVGSPVAITVASTGWMQSGQEYEVTDGTNFVYGFVILTGGTSLTFIPTLITGGAAGNTMLKRATMTPKKSPETVPTTINFTLPPVNTSVTVDVFVTDNYKDYDTVTIYDGTRNVYGYITVTSKTRVQFTPIYYFAGSSGNTMQRAVVKKCCVSLNPLLGKPSPDPSTAIGFPWLPAMFGPPTGTPSPLFDGFVPLVPNTRDPGLWTYISSAWQSPTAGITSQTVPSASTVDLTGQANGDFITITGNTGINAFLIKDGTRKTLKFASNPLITASNSVMLPNGISITAATGDVMEVVGEGGGLRCKQYTRASNGFVTVADGATMTMDMSLGNTSAPSGKFYLPLGGSRTLAVTNFKDGSVLYLVLAPTGSFTATWFANIAWSGGSAPTQTATSGKKDAFIFVYSAALSRWVDGGNKLNCS